MSEGPGVGIVSCFGLAGVALAFAVAASGEHRGACWLLVVVLAVVGLWPVVNDLVSRRFNPFDGKTLFLFVYTDIFCASTISVLLTGRARYPGLELDGEMAPFYVQALALAVVGLVCFHIGYSWGPARRLGYRLPTCGGFTYVSTKLVIVTGLAVSGLVALYFFRSYGGAGGFLAYSDQWREAGGSGSGPFAFWMGFVGPTCAIIYLIQKGRAHPTRAVFLKGGLLLGLSLAPNFLLGFRGAFLVPFLQYLLVWHYMRARFRLSIFAGIGVCVALLLTVYGIVREHRRVEMHSLGEDIVAQVLVRCPATEAVAVILHDMDNGGTYQYGWRSVIETATILVPRRIFPDKITPSGIRFTTLFFGPRIAQLEGVWRQEYGGIPPTAIGEFYWNFGIAGVIIGMFVLGVAGRVAYSYITRWPRPPEGSLLLYAVFVSTFWGAAEAPEIVANSFVIRYSILAAFLLIGSHRFRHTYQRGPGGDNRLRSGNVLAGVPQDRS
jgi:oligosaccharide repeat unit polymerase